MVSRFRAPAGSQGRAEGGGETDTAPLQVAPSESLKRVRDVLEKTRSQIAQDDFSKRARGCQQSQVPVPDGKKRGGTNTVPPTAKKVCDDSGVPLRSMRLLQYMHLGTIPINRLSKDAEVRSTAVALSSCGIKRAASKPLCPESIKRAARDPSSEHASLPMSLGASGSNSHLARSFPPRLSREPI